MSWTVYLFSDSGRTLWEKTFPARDERDAQAKAHRLVQPHLDRFDDAEDWVVEPAMNRAARRVAERWMKRQA